MALHKLSAAGVESLVKAETVTAAKRYGDGGGLWLNVSCNGGRRWVFMFRWRGKLTEMGLGSARNVALKRARQRAAAARELLSDGVNPLHVKKAAQREVPTFGDFADKLVDDLVPGFSNPKHVDQWRMTLTKYAKPLRDMPIDTITTEDVLSVLQPLWTKLPETASRLRGRIERVLSAAKAQGLREGENPARWRGHLDQRLPKRQKLTRGHHAALPFEQMPGFMAELREREATAARALEFLILSAARSSEVRGATWDEIDLENRIWVVPPDRMKSKRPHRVPLTPRMLELLKAMGKERKSHIIFPGARPGKPLSESTLKALLQRMGHGDVTAHGFRSAFRDWVSEKTSFPHEVAEMALAHVISNETEAAYRRRDLFEKRRTMMEAWAKFCGSERKPTEG